ncbi:MAG: oxidoreductase coenzyme F420-dependent [Frankiales bacterium]|nr:oxidoreductase coenzyme F420-dependent [Frankiales bacterium]
MRVAIIGDGRVARALRGRLEAAGHEVVLADLPDVEQAVRSADVVILDIPYHRYSELPAAPFTNKVTVDAINYDPDQDGSLPELEQVRATTELLARHLPGARIVKALNTLPLLTLSDIGPFRGDVPRPAVPIAGNEPGAKAVVAELLADLGFDPVDAGSLGDSWRLQPGMPVFGLLLDLDDVRARLALSS